MWHLCQLFGSNLAFFVLKFRPQFYVIILPIHFNNLVQYGCKFYERIFCLKLGIDWHLCTELCKGVQWG